MARVVVHGRGAGSEQCPYCRTSLLGTEAVWSCPACETEHHKGCAREHGGCTVHGCKGRYRLARPGPPSIGERYRAMHAENVTRRPRRRERLADAERAHRDEAELAAMLAFAGLAFGISFVWKPGWFVLAAIVLLRALYNAVSDTHHLGR